MAHSMAQALAVRPGQGQGAWLGSHDEHIHIHGGHKPPTVVAEAQIYGKSRSGKTGYKPPRACACVPVKALVIA